MPLRALLTLFLALMAVFCSAVPVELCASKQGVCVCCEKAAAAAACCAADKHAGSLTDRTAPTAVDLKVAAAPLRMVALPVFAAEPPLVYSVQVVRLPAAARFERLCVRLI